MKWITTFESSNTYSVLQLITSENETKMYKYTDTEIKMWSYIIKNQD
jgi:hypothetical protein